MPDLRKLNFYKRLAFPYLKENCQVWELLEIHSINIIGEIKFFSKTSYQIKNDTYFFDDFLDSIQGFETKHDRS